MFNFIIINIFENGQDNIISLFIVYGKLQLFFNVTLTAHMHATLIRIEEAIREASGCLNDMI